MPTWFRGTVAIGSLVVAIIAFYADSGLAPGIVALWLVLNTVVGLGSVLITRYDRRASGADDPTTLNLNR